MHNSARLILATQFYPPDTSTTAVYLGQIADTLAMDNQVVVISATPNPESPGADPRSNPAVIEIGNWNPRKSALVQRAAAACLLAARMFFSVLRRKIQRRRLLRNVSLHAALYGASGGEAARRGDATPDLRSLPGSA